jgi:hypothetical protein
MAAIRNSNKLPLLLRGPQHFQIDVRRHIVGDGSNRMSVVLRRLRPDSEGVIHDNGSRSYEDGGSVSKRILLLHLVFLNARPQFGCLAEI